MQEASLDRASPLVTFLMSTWNGERFLRAAIDSVITQTEPGWKMIIVDDCSTDTSQEILGSYDDPRITVIRLEPNQGQTAALNRGLETVETPWIARLDQDDISLPQRLEKQLAHIATHRDLVLVGSWVDFINDKAEVRGQFRPVTQPSDVRRALYIRGCPIVHSAATFRTDVARDLGGYQTNLDYAQDLALWIKMSEQGQIANVPEVLCHLRRHTNQISGTPRVSSCLIGETLSVIRELPSDLLGDSDTNLAWNDYRFRLTALQCLVSSRAGIWPLARVKATSVINYVARNPTVMVRLLILFTRRIFARH